MKQETIAKEFVTYIANKLELDLMYTIRKSSNQYEPGQSDIDLFIVPEKSSLDTMYYMWMNIEGVLRHGTCQHKNKTTGDITTTPLLDIVIFFNKKAQENCRQAMKNTNNYTIVKFKR